MNEQFAPTKTYDPIAIGKQADAAHGSGDVDRAQLIYQTALLEWQDDAREIGDDNSMQLEQIRRAIASLWLAYAHFYRRLKKVRKKFAKMYVVFNVPVG